jgi:hypothetical protein
MNSLLSNKVPVLHHTISTALPATTINGGQEPSTVKKEKFPARKKSFAPNFRLPSPAKDYAEASYCAYNAGQFTEF